MEEKKKIRIVYTALFIIAVIVTTYYQYVYQKFNASWNGINIYWWALFIGPLIALVMTCINYFIATQLGSEFSFDYENFTPGPFIYACMMAGCLLCSYFGITFTEPDRAWSSNHSNVQQDDRYQQSQFYQWYNAYQYDSGISTSSNSDNSSKSDDDNAGEALVVIVIIVIILTIIILSATIQHFWVVGSIAILCMMIPFLIRVWKKSEETPVRKQFRY